MLNWLRPDPVKKLQKIYEKKYAEAIQAQRNGNIAKYSQLITESEEIWKKIKSYQQK
ncbi:MAG: DUF6435 family protein [Oligoflexales bacterium]